MTTSCFLQLTRFLWHLKEPLCLELTSTPTPPVDGPKFPDDLLLPSPGLDERTGEVRCLGGRCDADRHGLGWDNFSPCIAGSINGILEGWRGNNYIKLKRIWTIWEESGRFGDAMTIPIPSTPSNRVLSKPHGRLQVEIMSGRRLT